jgi:hypothetical protein
VGVASLGLVRGVGGRRLSDGRWISGERLVSGERLLSKVASMPVTNKLEGNGGGGLLEGE